jgi:hypothetical protein
MSDSRFRAQVDRDRGSTKRGKVHGEVVESKMAGFDHSTLAEFWRPPICQFSMSRRIIENKVFPQCGAHLAAQ